MRRIKYTPEKLTKESVEALVGTIAELKTAERSLKAELDTAITELKRQYEPALTALNTQVDAILPKVQAWAEANPDEFGGNKSIQLLHGIIGFRTGMPCLKTAKGWTWERVLGSLKTLAPVFVRTKEEVDKAAIIAASTGTNPDQRLSVADLMAFGCRIEQSESFFVEPILHEVPNKVTA